MPKVIANLSEQIRSQARELLLSGGWESLTIRTVAARCHVAVGTVYNYYPAKDALIAAVMLEDWQSTLTRMEAAASAANSASDGIRAVFAQLCAFEAQYQAVWQQYATLNNPLPSRQTYHAQLISQIAAVLHPLLIRLQAADDPVLPTFLAETLLHLAPQGLAGYDCAAHLILRLITN